MIIKNKAIIEMRTALRFAYDEESKEIVMENCYNLSEQIDKDMNAAISSNKDNSEEQCRIEIKKILKQVKLDCTVENINSYETSLFDGLQDFVNKGERELGCLMSETLSH